MGMGLVNIPLDAVKKKGGLMGTLAGVGGAIASIGAVAAAPFTGGASLAALPYTTALTAAGSTLGNAIDPAKVTGGGKTQPVAPVQIAAENRMKSDPAAQVAQLNESISALGAANPRTKATLEPFFVSARDKLLGGMG